MTLQVYITTEQELLLNSEDNFFSLQSLKDIWPMVMMSQFRLYMFDNDQSVTTNILWVEYLFPNFHFLSETIDLFRQINKNLSSSITIYTLNM